MLNFSKMIKNLDMKTKNKNHDLHLANIKHLMRLDKVYRIFYGLQKDHPNMSDCS